MPHILMRKAGIATEKNNFNEADSLYQQLYKSFPDSYLADQSLFESAQLNELTIQQIEIARERYQLLIDQYPGSVYVAEARRRYRILRGDIL
jgi:TolA-binding protein